MKGTAVAALKDPTEFLDSIFAVFNLYLFSFFDWSNVSHEQYVDVCFSLSEYELKLLVVK